MNPTMSHFDLLDAFREPGCPMCRLVLVAVDRFMETTDYEGIGDPAVRERLRASLGFCNAHAHQWLARAHVLATSVAYLEILTRVRESMHASAVRRPSLRDAIASLVGTPPNRHDAMPGLAPDRPCPACDAARLTENVLGRTLLAALAEPRFRMEYEGSDGLCLPHLRQVLDRADDAPAVQVLCDVALDRMERLSEHLREIVRRHDYRFSGEPVGPERGAQERAVRLVAGEAGIVVSPR